MRHYAADSPAECRYNLYAISNHSGTTYSGHYTAYCRHPYSLAWHEYNDSRFVQFLIILTKLTKRKFTEWNVGLIFDVS